MAEAATYVDVQRALAEEAPAILRQIPLGEVQLSLPLDGRGPRLLASVRPDSRAHVPPAVEVVIDGRSVSIPVEAKPDYAEYEAY